MSKKLRFSEVVKKMRKDMKMSQREFGMKFGLDQQAVSKWENGKSLPSTNVLIQMSEAADITIDQLLFDVCEEDKKMIDNDATAIINQYNDFLNDLENGVKIDELLLKYDFLADDLSKEAKERIINQIEFERFKSANS